MVLPIGYHETQALLRQDKDVREKMKVKRREQGS